MAYFVYYQSSDNKSEQWTPIQDTQEAQVRREKAAHLSIYKTSKALVKGQDSSEVKYKGDLWFDIDRKPAEGDTSIQGKKEALKAAIIDMRRLLSYLDSIGLDPKYCRLFATGGKGFHVCIPAAVFDGCEGMKDLPKIHKYMAQIIAKRAECTVDMALYCSGMGRLLRVENKLRETGTYKVPVSYDEIKTMTPEFYLELVKKPRIETIHAPNLVCVELIALFSEARAEYKAMAKLKHKQGQQENLKVFSDGDNPKCVEWIVNNLYMKREEAGNFNKAKMSLARYIANAPLTDKAKDELVDKFAENWTSSRCPSKGSRVQAVQETLAFGVDNGFNCGMMTNILIDNPCIGCKLREELKRAEAERSMVQEESTGYERPTANGAGVRISNFTLSPAIRHMTEFDTENTFSSFDYYIVQGNADNQAQVVGLINLSHKAWQSCAEFKRQISHYMNLSWLGNDNDLQSIKQLLTNETALSQVEKTIVDVDKLGIVKYQNIESGVDEFAWVDENYSITSSGLTDRLKFTGVKLDGGKTRAIQMGKTKPYDGLNEDHNTTLRALLGINVPEILIPIIGWVFSCWLRTHVRAVSGTDKHLPSIHMFGQPSAGKTDTASLVSIIAGCDYRDEDPVSAPASTPHAIAVEGALTTTIPRVLDEVNPNKTPKHKYQAARNILKESARGSTQARGVGGAGGPTVRYTSTTTPIMFLATQISDEEEVLHRTVQVPVTRKHVTKEHTRKFFYVKQNDDKLEHLANLARAAMEETLMLDLDYVRKLLEDELMLMPEDLRFDRIGKNRHMVLVGLTYLHYVLQKRMAPEDILETVKKMHDWEVKWLFDNEGKIKVSQKAQEIDKIIETFGDMIAVDVGNINRRFIHGQNYKICGDTLHVWSTVFFTHYITHCRRDLHKAPELTSIKQYADLIQHQEYFLGNGLVSDVPNPTGWDSFSLPKMRERGIEADKFLVDIT